MANTFELVIPYPMESILFPEYTSSITLNTVVREPDWKRPEEVIEYLIKSEAPIKTKVSLLNYERKGLLTARRESAKKIFYDLNEVIELINTMKKK